MKKLLLLAMFAVVYFGCTTNRNLQTDSGINPLTAGISFDETHRLQFHFTPASGWMNDPNGTVYYDGEYHLFYQHNPDSTVWSPMHWGHAISTDLVHWEHLPVALAPDHLGTIFSGSAVVDEKNTSGLGTAENPPMVAIYTSAGKTQQQSLAFSLDRGRSWTKYEGNPVLTNPGIQDFRDPKVMWYEEGQEWIMSLAVADQISFYSSPNLIDWKHESDFGAAGIGGHDGVWECPDLIRMPVEGNGREKWVLLVSVNPGGPNGGSATQYFVGDFDGSRFVLDKQFEQELTAEQPAPRGELFTGFEATTFEDWEVEGDAFGTNPAAGTLPDQQRVMGFTGNRLANSYRNGDPSTGTLTSPGFIINSDYINLLVGGGNHEGRTGAQLVVDGEVVRSSTGNNSERLDWVSWNTQEFRNRKAKIQIYDRETGDWGYILVDNILFSSEPAREKQEGIWLDYGRDNYAGVTWSNVPESDGRKLFMGWMSNWEYAKKVPTTNWRSAMTIARSLKLQQTPVGLRVSSWPVEELQNIRRQSYTLHRQVIADTFDLSRNAPFTTSTFDLQLKLERLSPQGEFVVELSNEAGQRMLIGYDALREQYFTDRRQAGKNDFSEDFGGIHYAPRIAAGDDFSVRLLVDIASVEMFADNGATVMTDIFFPQEEFTRIRVISGKGEFRIRSGEFIDLESIYLREREVE